MAQNDPAIEPSAMKVWVMTVLRYENLSDVRLQGMEDNGRIGRGIQSNLPGDAKIERNATCSARLDGGVLIGHRRARYDVGGTGQE